MAPLLHCYACVPLTKLGQHSTMKSECLAEWTGRHSGRQNQGNPPPLLVVLLLAAAFEQIAGKFSFSRHLVSQSGGTQREIYPQRFWI